jgi:hypothetical protein
VTKITNCDKFRIALKQHVGETLPTASIRQIVWKYCENDMRDGSNHPSEHAIPISNETQCKCVRDGKPIFRRVQRGKYCVLPL